MPPRALVVLLLLACLPGLAHADTGRGGGEDEQEIRGPEVETSGPGHEGRDISRHGREGREPQGGPAGRPLDVNTRRAATAATVLASLPAKWCGTARGTDDTQHERDNGTWRFHAVYAVASDGDDRFAEVATALQTDAFQASSLIEKLYSRALRFDMGTDCGAQFLDITVVRLPESEKTLETLATQPTGTLDAVARALDAQGMVVTKTTDTLEAVRQYTRNYLVWLDAPAPKDACGQATMESDTERNPDTNRSNFGGKVAVVFRDGKGFCNSTAARHEMAHTMGALQASAPHLTGGAHCADALEDTMCVESAPQVGPPLSDGFFDFGNDDYWSAPGRPLDWWTVELNRFLCLDVACNVPTPRQAPLRLKTTAVRRSTHWTMHLLATGAGKGELTVSCRPRRGAAIRVVRRREVAPPARLKLRVHCFSKPRAELRPR